MAARVSAMVEPLSENRLTFWICMGYTRTAMEPMVSRAELEHIFRTMLQIVDNAYYRAGYLTVEHDMLGTMKRMLEMGIGALQQLQDDGRAVVEIIESVETHTHLSDDERMHNSERKRA
jgi:hypothetical protein